MLFVSTFQSPDSYAPHSQNRDLAVDSIHSYRSKPSSLVDGVGDVSAHRNTEKFTMVVDETAPFVVLDINN